MTDITDTSKVSNLWKKSRGVVDVDKNATFEKLSQKEYINQVLNEEIFSSDVPNRIPGNLASWTNAPQPTQSEYSVENLDLSSNFTPGQTVNLGIIGHPELTYYHRWRFEPHPTANALQTNFTATSWYIPDTSFSNNQLYSIARNTISFKKGGQGDYQYVFYIDAQNGPRRVAELETPYKFVFDNQSGYILIYADDDSAGNWKISSTQTATTGPILASFIKYTGAKGAASDGDGSFQDGLDASFNNVDISNNLNIIHDGLESGILQGSSFTITPPQSSFLGPGLNEWLIAKVQYDNNPDVNATGYFTLEVNDTTNTNSYLKLNFIAGVITKEVTLSSTPSPPSPTSSSTNTVNSQLSVPDRIETIGINPVRPEITPVEQEEEEENTQQITSLSTTSTINTIEFQAFIKVLSCIRRSNGVSTDPGIIKLNIRKGGIGNPASVLLTVTHNTSIDLGPVKVRLYKNSLNKVDRYNELQWTLLSQDLSVLASTPGNNIVSSYVADKPDEDVYSTQTIGGIPGIPGSGSTITLLVSKAKYPNHPIEPFTTTSQYSIVDNSMNIQGNLNIKGDINCDSSLNLGENINITRDQEILSSTNGYQTEATKDYTDNLILNSEQGNVIINVKDPDYVEANDGKNGQSNYGGLKIFNSGQAQIIGNGLIAPPAPMIELVSQNGNGNGIVSGTNSNGLPYGSAKIYTNSEKNTTIQGAGHNLSFKTGWTEHDYESSKISFLLQGDTTAKNSTVLMADRNGSTGKIEFTINDSRDDTDTIIFTPKYNWTQGAATIDKPFAFKVDSTTDKTIIKTDLDVGNNKTITDSSTGDTVVAGHSGRNTKINSYPDHHGQLTNRAYVQEVVVDLSSTEVDTLGVVDFDWVTIAKTGIFRENSSNGNWECITRNDFRGNAVFEITDKTGSHHHNVKFIANAHFNKTSLKVLSNQYYARKRFEAIRIYSAGTYDGNVLQVKIRCPAVSTGTATITGYNSSGNPIYSPWNGSNVSSISLKIWQNTNDSGWVVNKKLIEKENDPTLYLIYNPSLPGGSSTTANPNFGTKYEDKSDGNECIVAIGENQDLQQTNKLTIKNDLNLSGILTMEGGGIVNAGNIQANDLNLSGILTMQGGGIVNAGNILANKIDNNNSSNHLKIGEDCKGVEIYGDANTNTGLLARASSNGLASLNKNAFTINPNGEEHSTFNIKMTTSNYGTNTNKRVVTALLSESRLIELNVPLRLETTSRNTLDGTNNTSTAGPFTNTPADISANSGVELAASSEIGSTYSGINTDFSGQLPAVRIREPNTNNNGNAEDNNYILISETCYDLISRYGLADMFADLPTTDDSNGSPSSNRRFTGNDNGDSSDEEIYEIGMMQSFKGEDLKQNNIGAGGNTVWQTPFRGRGWFSGCTFSWPYGGTAGIKVAGRAIFALVVNGTRVIEWKSANPSSRTGAMRSYPAHNVILDLPSSDWVYCGGGQNRTSSDPPNVYRANSWFAPPGGIISFQLIFPAGATASTDYVELGPHDLAIDGTDVTLIRMNAFFASMPRL